ncbi:MAG: 4-hydroxy-tetrahydrodipicolinate synthase [Bacteroides sp.]|nr:4-hydroxy-tetrahydrodipicolinate synthase [Bacteroidales bacterium]MBD5250848.1 4-hydroxy-tetrahydrodipicolinate synthase [Barnesiella sp.]MBD5253288.1 4-hydroxy-tetrahydrodipicolinate synthase [Barnesiella sp.]MBD5343664.1 4-hydroxy-tetrahydrodipicolinate synthase [Bacteroides sp.]MBD5367943.1 4-hydroxy-tetrahydrodipicolinate synthase [Bacteroides sp.]
MAQSMFKGLGVAIPTPFCADESLDEDALARHIDFLREASVDFIVALGTTAENPTLTPDERQRTVDIVKSHAGNIPVVMGLGGNSTRAVVEELKRTEFDGISAILSVAPYYNKPSQTGLYRHFAAIAEASPVPVILYNVPSRTGVNIEAATSLALAHDYPGKIVAVKEASGRLDQAETMVIRRDAGFAVLSGDDSLAHSMIKLGGDGVISVLGNVFPREFGTMIRASLAGDITRASIIHQHFSALYTLLFRDGNPSGVKAALNILHPYFGETLRLPLTPVTASTRQELAANIAALQ